MPSFLGGVQVLQEEMLQDVENSVRTIVGNKQFLTLEKYRDIMKMADFGDGQAKVDFLCIGMENQSSIDYAMPIRVGMYDFMNYEGQIKQIEKKHRKKKDYGKNSDEFLSGFQKQDTLIPVITIVVYYGKKKWDGAKSLKEMMCYEGLPEAIKHMLPEYPIHVVSVRELGEERLHQLRSELKEIFGFLKYEEDKRKLQIFIEKNRKGFETLDKQSFQMIQAYADTRLDIEKEENGGKVNMCKALDDMREESMMKGMQLGIKEGMEKGFNQGKKEGIKELLLNLCKEKMITEEIVCDKLGISKNELKKMLM